jgi:nucleoside phosphorylase
MTGIRGGVPEKTALGDVIFAESAVDWDYGKWEEILDPRAVYETGVDKSTAFRTTSKFVSRPDPQSIRGSRAHGAVRDLLNRDPIELAILSKEIAQMSEGKISKFTPHLAPFGSGSSVVASEFILEQVRSLNDSIRGVDMECYGFYFAAKTTHVAKPEVLCIKAVSDF